MVRGSVSRNQPFVLERPRLLEALDAALETRMTLVVAPAGYGKSELLREWMTHNAGVAIVAISLDERDNDPGRFWQNLVEGLAEQVPAVGDGPARMAKLLTRGAIAVLVEAVCEALAAQGTTVVIVLDDFHFVHDPTVLDSIDLFRDEMPESVHVVIGGRQDPRLPVSRLRLRGELTELREADLRFTEPETGALIAGSGFALSEADVALLQARTEGWCAALRLAILSMGAATDPSTVVRDLSGSDRSVADYLLEEVVSEMSIERRDFLLSTSVCDDVDGALGEALTGRNDAAAMLARLAAEGVFTTALAENVGWYRYHRLLRDLLRVRLRGDDPTRFLELHGHAAAWHHEHGDGVASVRHALVAGQVERAAQWLGEIAPGLVQTGRAATVESLSAIVIAESPEPSALTLLTRWWALYMVGESDATGQPSEIEELGQRLQDAIEALPTTGDRDEERVHGGSPIALTTASSLHYVRALRARARGDIATVLSLDDPAVIPSPSGRVEGFLAEGLLWQLRAAEAKPLIGVFLAHGESDRYLPTIVHGLGLDAMAAVTVGELGHARESVASARRISDENGLGQLIQTMYSRLVSTWLAWMAGELSEAEDAAVGLQRYCEVAADAPIVVQHALLRSRIRWSLGDSLGARSLLDRATVLSNGRPVEGHFAERLALGRATLDLLDGEVESAQRAMPDWRSRLEDPSQTMRERLVQLRMLLLTGGDLAPIHMPGPPDLWLGPLEEIDLGRLRAMAYLQEGRVDDAIRVLTVSLREADRLGVIQPTLDDRARLAPILGTASREAGVKLPGLGAEAPATETVYVEPLSKRELTILRLLATHLTYAEMADELYISPNTVRSHVGAVFRKLAVNRRSEAVTQARAYGLIS